VTLERNEHNHKHIRPPHAVVTGTDEYQIEEGEEREKVFEEWGIQEVTPDELFGIEQAVVQESYEELHFMLTEYLPSGYLAGAIDALDAMRAAATGVVIDGGDDENGGDA
jgi:hypothetical protein